MAKDALKGSGRVGLEIGRGRGGGLKSKGGGLKLAISTWTVWWIHYMILDTRQLGGLVHM
jgi:hypothetical protein